ncbi:MAG: carbohydrate binding domain-containing protein [Victivallaceae bacterium]
MKQAIFALLATLSWSLVAADGPNLIRNPGFEENGEWVVWGSVAGMTNEDKNLVLTCDESTAASGKRSLKITDNWEKFSPYVVQFVPLQNPAKTYLLTFKAKAADGAEFRAGAMFNKGTAAKHEYIGGVNSALRGTGEWKEYSVPIENLKEGTDLLAVVLAPCKWGEGNTGTVWFDDVSLTAIE